MCINNNHASSYLWYREIWSNTKTLNLFLAIFMFNFCLLFFDLQETWRFVNENLTVQAIKNLSEYTFRQLKQHQHKIKTETGILLEITLNIFKCLIISLFPLKFLLWQQHQFYLFQLASCLFVKFAMVPGVYILLCPQEEEHHNHQKDLNPLSLHYYGKVTVELKKKTTQRRNLIVFMVLVI